MKGQKSKIVVLIAKKTFSFLILHQALFLKKDMFWGFCDQKVSYHQDGL